MSGQPFRLPEGGGVDRTKPVGFTFNGTRYQGYEGDTLASALLANGVHLVGRGFKYHRPRGIVSAGAEEPNALVQLGDDAGRTDPNMRATQVALYEGLIACSQNCWPSVETDVGAVADVLSPLFPAGFYYKTFMWPAGLWRSYEAVIRRAAGLGKSPRAHDPDRYDHCHAHCDVLVVGSGPAGLSAAMAAAKSGARVILAEEQEEFGGALLSEPADGIAIGGKSARQWRDDAIATLAAAGDVRLLPRTTCFGYYHGNYLAMLERVTDHLPVGSAAPGTPRQRLWKVRARQVVLATGAIERPLIFAENDRPGIMLAGAVRTYLNRYGVRAGSRAVIVTNNDSAYRTALDLRAQGVCIAAIVDLRPEPTGALALRAAAEGLEILAGYSILGTEGRKRVRRVWVAPISADGGTVNTAERRVLDCDLVAVSGGWNPAVHLLSQSRGTVRYEDGIASFVPDRSFQPERSAGACNGAFGTAECLAQGSAAGVEAAKAAGFSARKQRAAKVEETEEAPARQIWLLPSDRAPERVKAFVDQQNDVTAKDLKLAIGEGYRSVEHVKRYTTTGMGTDQGKTGNVSALGIVAGALGQTIPEIGVTTFRPPYTPVTFGAIAGRGVKELYAPVRKTAMHRWHEENGAVFENVGQWKRPWYYPQAGESMDDAVDREVAAVRRSVGIFDATTLGKIDIQGRDAAEFLNRIYTNAWSKLGVGRCRYGLMLGEDGMVMDDGVTTRLGENHFHMTTTTGGAANVMGWLEEWAQTEWPELKVHMTSVTDQMGGDRRRRTQEPRPGLRPRRGYRFRRRGLPAHVHARGADRRRAGPGVPDQLLRRDGLRGQRARVPRHGGLAGHRRDRQGVRRDALRHRDHACAAGREGLHHRRPGNRRHDHPVRPADGLDRQPQEAGFHRQPFAHPPGHAARRSQAACRPADRRPEGAAGRGRPSDRHRDRAAGTGSNAGSCDLQLPQPQPGPVHRPGACTWRCGTHGRTAVRRNAGTDHTGGGDQPCLL